MQVAAGRAFDVIVIGSGASGGWAAKRLAEAGVDVALLDAGRVLQASDYREHLPAQALPYRGLAPEPIRRTRPVQKDCYACTEWNYDWYRNDLEEPYTTPADKQAHDVKNLFVMDAAGFTSGACQNPTLTIMALAVRSTDYLLGEMKRGNL